MEKGNDSHKLFPPKICGTMMSITLMDSKGDYYIGKVLYTDRDKRIVNGIINKTINNYDIIFGKQCAMLKINSLF